MVTDETTLDLTGKTVQTITVESSNATGTTFTVDNKTTAFQVRGGPGADTLQTSSFAFTPLEREAIFATTLIETIIDTDGTFNAPLPDPNTFVLTTGTDVLAPTTDDTTVNANALTLNAVDDLDGGLGFDTLALFGGGTFDLNSLAGYDGFEQVRIVNFIANDFVNLTLRDGTTSDVTISGLGVTQTNVSGTTIVGNYQGGDGRDFVTLSGDASATTIDLGNGDSQSATLLGDTSATTILGGNAETLSIFEITPALRRSISAAATSIGWYSVMRPHGIPTSVSMAEQELMID